MKLMFVFTLCLLIGITFAADDSDANKKTSTPKPTTTVPPSTSSTTEAPKTTTTPPPTSSTTPPSSTSTPAPTTPTPPTPSPTTPTPTTPSPTTAPTVPPSSTTTAAPPTKWIVVDPKTNITCIIAEMEATFNLHVNKETYPIKISPATAKAAGGDCGPSNQTLKLVWEDGNLMSSMVMTFTESKKNYYVSAVNLSLAHNSSSGFVMSEFSAVNLTLFESSVNTSYYCESVEIPQLKNSKNETVDTNVKGLALEAFRSNNQTSFSTAHYCSGEVPDIVPLVVGIALAALVLVVVIAYLIGRRRSQARGYLSM